MPGTLPTCHIRLPAMGAGFHIDFCLPLWVLCYYAALGGCCRLLSRYIYGFLLPACSFTVLTRLPAGSGYCLPSVYCCHLPACHLPFLSGSCLGCRSCRLCCRLMDSACCTLDSAIYWMQTCVFWIVLPAFSMGLPGFLDAFLPAAVSFLPLYRYHIPAVFSACVFLYGCVLECYCFLDAEHRSRFLPFLEQFWIHACVFSAIYNTIPYRRSCTFSTLPPAGFLDFMNVLCSPLHIPPFVLIRSRYIPFSRVSPVSWIFSALWVYTCRSFYRSPACLPAWVYTACLHCCLLTFSACSASFCYTWVWVY